MKKDISALKVDGKLVVVVTEDSNSTLYGILGNSITSLPENISGGTIVSLGNHGEDFSSVALHVNNEILLLTKLAVTRVREDHNTGTDSNNTSRSVENSNSVDITSDVILGFSIQDILENPNLSDIFLNYRHGRTIDGIVRLSVPTKYDSETVLDILNHYKATKKPLLIVIENLTDKIGLMGFSCDPKKVMEVFDEVLEGKSYSLTFTDVSLMPSEKFKNFSSFITNMYKQQQLVG